MGFWMSLWQWVEDVFETFAQLFQLTPSFVVHASLCLVAALVTALSYSAIIGSYYRTTNPALPATKAVGAALTLLTPAAALLAGVRWVSERHIPNSVFPYTSATLMACMCGVPLLLWFPAAALTAYPPFRDAQMPEPVQPAQRTAAIKPAGSSSGLAATAAAVVEKEE